VTLFHPLALFSGASLQSVPFDQLLHGALAFEPILPTACLQLARGGQVGTGSPTMCSIVLTED
jgi:hypothetical protein